MGDEVGFDAAQEAAKIEKPKLPTEPPKEKTPLGVPEQKIIERIDQDGDEDKVLRDIAREGGDRSNPSDSLSQEHRVSGIQASTAIFEGVYDQMRQGAHGATPEEQGQRFIDVIAEKAQMHIGEIESQNLTNQDIYQEMWGKMSAYINRYSVTPRFEEKKRDVSAVYSRLTGHINGLVKSGEVDPLTAKVFARYLERYKNIGGHHYNAIVRNNQELPEGTLQQKAPDYAEAVGRLVSDYGEDAKEQETFVHFNADKQTGEVTTRIYISPDLAQSPAKVLDAWSTSLSQTDLKDKIYFKVPEGLSKRQEGIVVYVTDQTNPEDVEKLLTSFSDACPLELLSSEPMPSAVPIARGIAMAPELRNIKTFMKYSGLEEGISYNEWVASSTQLAFELAYHEVTKSGEVSVTPKMLKDQAAGYFNKIVKLSGVNPETMVPNSLGGKLPTWAARTEA